MTSRDALVHDNGFDRVSLTFAYFDRRSSVLILHNPKCASTSLRTFCALTEGIDVSKVCDEAIFGEVRWEQAIYSILLANDWRNLIEEDRSEVILSDTIRKVGIIRDPAARAWSAWLSKVAVREPAFRYLCPRSASYSTSEWLFRLRDLPSALAEFERFALDLADGSPASSDPHFAPQVEVFRDFLTLAEFVDITQVDRLLAQLESHHPGTPPTPPLNESGFGTPLNQFTEATTAALSDFYGSDYSHFGFERERAGSSSSPSSEEWLDFMPSVEMRVRHAQRLAVTADALAQLRGEST
jgi:hypothetical protein